MRLSNGMIYRMEIIFGNWFVGTRVCCRRVINHSPTMNWAEGSEVDSNYIDASAVTKRKGKEIEKRTGTRNHTTRVCYRKCILLSFGIYCTILSVNVISLIKSVTLRSRVLHVVCSNLQLTMCTCTRDLYGFCF